MKIHKMIDTVCKIKNQRLAALTYKFYKAYLNLTYPISCRSGYGLDPQSNIVISLTTFPERINTVWVTINTLLNQTVKPKEIVLWLAEDQFKKREEGLPDKLLALKEKGLSIRFCENLYPHKKYYYTIKENPECSVITVDDDVFYPETLIEELQRTSQKYPGAICCTWGHVVTYTDNGEIAEYQSWRSGVNDGRMPTMQLVPVGCGGVLYPPYSLDSEVFNKQAFEKLCLKTDDLWLKSMAVKTQTPSVRVDKEAKIFFNILSTQSKGLHHENVGNNQNNVSMNNILSVYPEIQQILYKDYKKQKIR